MIFCFPSSFIFSRKVVFLLFQIPSSQILTFLKANFLVSNDIKKVNHLSPHFFTFCQSFEAPLFIFPFPFTIIIPSIVHVLKNSSLAKLSSHSLLSDISISQSRSKLQFKSTNHIQIWIIILVINKSVSRCAVVRFCSSLVLLQTELDSTQFYDRYLSSAPVKAGGPSIEELEYLSLELGGKWEELGGRLGFNQAQITCFDEDYRKLKRKALKMLMAWKQREGSNATYKVLCDALCDKKVQCTLLAEKFCCEWDCKNCLSLILYSKRLSHFYIT